MCGRYVSALSKGEIQLEFRLDVVADGYEPRQSWNVAPTQDVPIIVERKFLATDDWVGTRTAPDGAADRVRALTPAFWGLIPPWAKDTSRPMINARVETLAEKKSFAPALKKRRCIIPASGYFEWRKTDRQPFYIFRSDAAPLAFAGLYSWWRDADRWLLTASIVTRDSVGEMAAIHDRVPLILHRLDYDQWLDPRVDGETILASLDQSQPDLNYHPVGREVGNVRHDTPANIVDAASQSAG